MSYLDSSALVKLVREEVSSAELAEWLADRGTTTIASSELATVEVLRACRRWDPRVLPSARTLLSGVDLVPLSRDVVADAAQIGDPLLRSPDALHLASSLSIGATLSAFAADDELLREAALTLGLPCVAPGRDGPRP